ncbi:NADH-quinone oxidoreductase subunit C [Thermococcus barophilus]|uniref:Energy-conserving NiFe-hydrogenase (Ferredoxin) beta subunit n=1 Tax=Thermococcus barophilus (strain DSM 11836 / MP) TaxID=391623 RepID=F0LID3_THEBM|nr:NADH-quinone oxidoreductase subunit C [Thermococcus barophilus]ADT84463.1 energy-conserving NiFe-hydrogenase (ferredoxin) beta subunit [Thermococcus barophilus MP]
MTPEEFAERIKAKFEEISIRITENKLPHPRKRVWIEVDRERFKELVRFLKEVNPTAQFSIIIAEDRGDRLTAKYHWEMFWEQGESLSVIVGTSCPKNDPVLPTITDIFPSSLPYEREVQEFLGIKYEGIPDPRRLFLPDDFPEGIYPLRLDETGIKPDMVKNAGHPYRRGSK